MTVEIAVSLLAAAIPITALVLKLSGCVSMVDFVRLETQFYELRREVRAVLDSKKVESYDGNAED